MTEITAQDFASVKSMTQGGFFVVTPKSDHLCDFRPMSVIKDGVVSNSESRGALSIHAFALRNGNGHMPDYTSPPARSNPVVLTLLTAAALAGAMLAGASINGGANDSIRELFRGAGFGRTSEIVAEQRRQATALQNIELAVSRARADVAVLNTRVDEAENLYRAAVAAVPGSLVSGSREPGNQALDYLPSGDLPKGSDHELDLGALRSSLDEQAERNRNEFHAVNKRLDWLEKFIYGPEGAVQPAGTARRPGRQFARGWRVLHAANGAAVISGKGGAIDVIPGSKVPDLGRVSAIRQERGRWVVVTDNGMTIRER
jgi:hypothetical protein